MSVSIPTAAPLFVNPVLPHRDHAAAHSGTASAEIATLTQAISRGDETAFREFHQRFAGRLFGYVLVLHRGDEVAARETWQTTLVKAARRMKPFAGETQLWAWLATIARHTARDAYRSTSRFVRLRERIATLWSLPARNANAAGRDPYDVLQAALARLEAADRALLAAKYFENRPVRVIAADRACSEKAAESALTRARQRLRAAFLEELRDE